MKHIYIIKKTDIGNTHIIVDDEIVNTYEFLGYITLKDVGKFVYEVSNINNIKTYQVENNEQMHKRLDDISRSTV